MENSAQQTRNFDIRQRTLKFSVLIIRLITLLPKTPAGFAIANQVVRSGTSIGANVEEAQDASSRKEFTHTMMISLREARETEYWLRIIKETNLIFDSKLGESLQEVNELIKILTAIVKKTKARTLK